MSVCRICQATFVPIRQTKIYCSNACRNRSQFNAAKISKFAAIDLKEDRPKQNEIADNLCGVCGIEFQKTTYNRRYCSNICAMHSRRPWGPRPNAPPWETKCANCQTSFMTTRADKLHCSSRCRIRFNTIMQTTRTMVERVSDGTFSLQRSVDYRGRWKPDEIAALRADPFCILPNRSLAAQWSKCEKLGISRDRSLFVSRIYSDEQRYRRSSSKKPTERRNAIARRCYFRRRIRKNPEPALAELRKLASGHPHAEDLILEGFATMLRDCVPAAEAFKLAKAEVNRTSAQPFKEQSFNPDVDYAARETGRQVARASDIRSARGEG